MAISILGVGPFVSTTVTNATTPTTTQFSVTSPTGFLVRMGLVIGGSQLTQITDITGSVFTVNPPITAPVATDTVVNFSVPFTNSLGNSMAMWKELNAASLRTVADTGFTDDPTTLVYVVDLGVFQWSSASTATDDGALVIKPTATAGAGRWLLKIPTSGGGVSGTWTAITADTALAAGVNYILNSTSRLNLTLPSTFSTGATFQIKSKNTGGAKITLASGDTVYYGDSILTNPFNIVGCKYPSATITALEADTKWSIDCGNNSGVLWFDFLKGYFAGGYNGSSYVATIDKLTFSSEAITNLGATLNAARGYGKAAASQTSDKGYFFGGLTPSRTTEIDGINMATDAAINPAATLAAALDSAGIASDYVNDKAYIMGGYTTVPTDVIQKWLHSTEARSTISAVLVRTTYDGWSFGSISHGYFLGGTQPTTNQATLAILSFANESTTETRNVLKAIQNGATPPVDSTLSVQGASSSYYDGGYIFGGNGGGRTLYIGKMMFDTETEKHMASSLIIDICQCGASQSANKAYIAGGAVVTTAITSYDYVNETVATLSAVLVGTRAATFGLP